MHKRARETRGDRSVPLAWVSTWHFRLTILPHHLPSCGARYHRRGVLGIRWFSCVYSFIFIFPRACDSNRLLDEIPNHGYMPDKLNSTLQRTHPCHSAIPLAAHTLTQSNQGPKSHRCCSLNHGETAPSELEHFCDSDTPKYEDMRAVR